MTVILKTLGRSDLNITRVGFGTWPLSKPDRPSESDAIKVILTALEAGINFLDTADAYCLDQTEMGYCEQLISKALKLFKASGSRTTDSIVIATKGGCIRPSGAWATNGKPEHLKKACDHSLKCLGVDQIALYQLHAPDPAVPFEESINALAELKHIGKVRHIGLSNVSVKEIMAAQKITEIVSVQNRCNPFDLTSFQNGVVAHCEKHSIGFIAYSPVGGDEEKHLIAENHVLLTIGKRYQASPFQIALAWLLSLSASMVVIPATRHIENAKSSAKVLNLVLEQDDIQILNDNFGYP